MISASVDELRSAINVLELPPPPSVVRPFLNFKVNVFENSTFSKEIFQAKTLTPAQI